MSATLALCRHCQHVRRLKARGLCSRCYDRPEVRVLYPCLVSQRRPESQGGHPLPSEPTTATPATPEKVAVLEERAALGLALFHPLDPVIVHHQRRRRR
jgi:hypothetical protein